MTVQGGNDSADGSDSIVGGRFADVILGNGGADSMRGGNGANVLVGGFGADIILGGNDGDLIFGNQDNDSIDTGPGNSETVFGGQGDDVILNAGPGQSLLLGNEGNDTIDAGDGADTVTGGPGSDVFVCVLGSEDGNGAAGGAIERITDVNFAEDRFSIGRLIGLAANAGVGNAASLDEAARNALNTVFLQNESRAQSVAAVFTWVGRTYLAWDTFTNGIFVDGNDILIDITGATGTISASNFVM
jgi:Ca2+-binding RTX toxin-like protein